MCLCVCECVCVSLSVSIHLSTCPSLFSSLSHSHSLFPSFSTPSLSPSVYLFPFLPFPLSLPFLSLILSLPLSFSLSLSHSLSENPFHEPNTMNQTAILLGTNLRFSYCFRVANQNTSNSSITQHGLIMVFPGLGTPCCCSGRKYGHMTPWILAHSLYIAG